MGSVFAMFSVLRFDFAALAWTPWAFVWVPVFVVAVSARPVIVAATEMGLRFGAIASISGAVVSTGLASVAVFPPVVLARLYGGIAPVAEVRPLPWPLAHLVHRPMGTQH